MSAEQNSALCAVRAALSVHVKVDVAGEFTACMFYKARLCCLGNEMQFSFVLTVQTIVDFYFFFFARYFLKEATCTGWCVALKHGA